MIVSELPGAVLQQCIVRCDIAYCCVRLCLVETTSQNPFSYNRPIMSHSTSSVAEIAPRCRCGNGAMRLFTSHTKTNPNRKFWDCPRWIDGNRCAAFLWKDKGGDQCSDADSKHCDQFDIHHDLHNISNQIECLKMEFNKNGHEQLLYLQRMLYVCMFMSIIICIGLAKLFSF